MIVFITLSFTSIDSVYYVLRYHLQVLIVNIGLSEGSVVIILPKQQIQAQLIKINDVICAPSLFQSHKQQYCIFLNLEITRYSYNQIMTLHMEYS